MRMATYVIRRLILLIPVIIGVMSILFVLISSLPIQTQLRDAFGPPPQGKAWVYNPTAPCNDVGQPGNGSCPNPIYLSDAGKLGLLGPVPERWAIYVYHGLTFQWGEVDTGSFVGQNYRWADQMPVIQLLVMLLPYTIELAIYALVIILLIAIPVGNLSAINRNRPIDQAARVMSFSGYAMPAFLLGTLSLMAMVLLVGAWSGSYSSHPVWCRAGESLYQEFYGSWPAANCIVGYSVKNGGFPLWIAHSGVQSTPTGFPTLDAILHGDYPLAVDTVIRMTVPALVIAFGTVASLLRFVRNSMLEVMNLDYIRTARAKGVPERTVVNRHAGRNSLNVTITVLGLTFAGFIGGFPVIEEVFGLHGVGAILAQAVIPGPDFSIIFGSTLLFTYLVVMANMIVDVLYAYLDPRVRLG